MVNGRGAAPPVYRLHIRTARVDGVDELHGIVTDLEADPSRTGRTWALSRSSAGKPRLHPPDSTATLQQRIDVMLAETGWELAPGTSVQDRLVRRRMAGFRSQRPGDQVAVLTRDTGVLVDKHAVSERPPGQDADTVLLRDWKDFTLNAAVADGVPVRSGPWAGQDDDHGSHRHHWSNRRHRTRNSKGVASRGAPRTGART